MKARYKKAVDTRRLYRYEKLFERTMPKDVRRLRPIQELQDISHFIWSSVGRGRTEPKIVAGRGTKYNGAWVSYACGGRIELSRGQRNVMVLLHELVHELGHDYHDTAFVEQYIRLLVRFGGCEEGELRIGLCWLNIKVG